MAGSGPTRPVANTEVSSGNGFNNGVNVWPEAQTEESPLSDLITRTDQSANRGSPSSPSTIIKPAPMNESNYNTQTPDNGFNNGVNVWPGAQTQESPLPNLNAHNNQSPNRDPDLFRSAGEVIWRACCYSQRGSSLSVRSSRFPGAGTQRED